MNNTFFVLFTFSDKCFQSSTPVIVHVFRCLPPLKRRQGKQYTLFVSLQPVIQSCFVYQWVVNILLEFDSISGLSGPSCFISSRSAKDIFAGWQAQRLVTPFISRLGQFSPNFSMWSFVFLYLKCKLHKLSRFEMGRKKICPVLQSYWKGRRNNYAKEEINDDAHVKTSEHDWRRKSKWL